MQEKKYVKKRITNEQINQWAHASVHVQLTQVLKFNLFDAWVITRTAYCGSKLSHKQII